MTNDERILELGQEIYRAMNKTSNQNVNGSDLTVFLNDTISWVNQFLPELEKEAYWNFSRTNDAEIATISEGATVTLPENVRTLIIAPNRDLTIRQDGSVVSTFKLVNPNQVSDPTDLDTRDRVALIGRNLIFSRSFREEELGGQVTADAIDYIPRLSHEDTSLIDVVDPLQLVVLGTAKNWILPDKVSGGLSASFTQKYAELLRLCKEENDRSNEANQVIRDNFGYIGGVGF